MVADVRLKLDLTPSIVGAGTPGPLRKME